MDMSIYILKFILSDNSNEIKNKNSIFNTGLSEKLQKKNLINFILKYLPNTKIHYSNNVEDKRNYRVNFKRLKSYLIKTYNKCSKN